MSQIVPFEACRIKRTSPPNISSGSAATMIIVFHVADLPTFSVNGRHSVNIEQNSSIHARKMLFAIVVCLELKKNHGKKPTSNHQKFP